jgi:hypothetical protein
MQRLRGLYEEDVVPVREIAALAGVTERTLYKYIEKGAWRRRYRLSAPNSPPLTPPHKSLHSGARERDPGGEGNKSWQASPRFAPVKGAGGRFIRREDKDKPFARGIKALDPEGAARAVAKAARAAAFSAPAKKAAALSKLARAGIAAQKKHERAEDARIRSFGMLMQMMTDLTRARRAPHINLRADAVAEKMQHMILELAEQLMLPSS